MSPPRESAKNASPARQKIATNHGNTNTSIHIRPHTGRSRQSHVADRSKIASVAIVSATTLRHSGPLSRIPPDKAVQQIAGHVNGGSTVPSHCNHYSYTRTSPPITAHTNSHQ